MFDVIKLIAVFAAVVATLRYKVPVGLSMLGGALLMALLYAMPPGAIMDAARTAFIGKTTFEFLGALMLIRVLEHVMRERELLTRMMSASRAYLRSRRAGIVAMPVLIGLLPSVGGAYFSAPMVEESTRSTGMSAEEKGFINFWFRHIWEPIAPEVYIAVAISGSSQHMSGCSGSKTIIAINKDREANIFRHARFGVVGDWKKVLPAFTAKIKELVT